MPKLFQLRNILKGAIPTTDTFGTAPDNLQNATDENLSTVTGAGSKVMSGAGYWGNIIYDLGKPRNVLFGGYIGLKTSVSTSITRIFLEASVDGVTYIPLGSASSNFSTNSTSEYKIHLPTQMIIGSQYIRIRNYVDAAATPEIKLYDLRAYELG